MLTVASRLDVMHRLGRAMADPSRSRILLRLLEGPAYPAGLAEELGLTRQNVSNHLACLRDCGIVVAEPEGRQSRYEIADSTLAHALGELLTVVLEIDENAATHEPERRSLAEPTSLAEPASLVEPTSLVERVETPECC